MNRTRREFLACTAFPIDKDGRLDFLYFVDSCIQVTHWRACSDHLVLVDNLFPAGNFAFQQRLTVCMPENKMQTGDIQWKGVIVVGVLDNECAEVA